MVEHRKLPRSAYELKEGERFVPLQEGGDPIEVTLKAVASGIVLGLFFGAANTYLGLKAGLTVSTSIPGRRANRGCVSRVVGLRQPLQSARGQSLANNRLC